MNAANLLLAMTLSSGVPAQLGGMPYVGPGRDIIVAAVKSYSLKTATADLIVHGVLRGDPRLDRRKALWTAPVDMSEGKLQLPLMPDPVPAVVGKTFILSGDVQRQGNKFVFVLSPYWRYAYNTENLKVVRNYLIREHASSIAYELGRIADATMLGVRRSFWRHAMTDAKIQQFAKDADFIVVGKIVGGGSNLTAFGCEIKVSKVLKGVWRVADHNQFIGISLPVALDGLMDREKPYLLFLSERGMMIGSGGGAYPVLADGQAVTIADETVVRKVEDAVKALPPTPPRPLLLLEIQVGRYDTWKRYCRMRDQLATSFDKAADNRGSVLRTIQFNLDFDRLLDRDQAFIAKHTRARVPEGNIYLAVRLDEAADKPARVKLTALNLETAQGNVILTREWHVRDQADMDAKVAEVMRKLIASAPK